MNKFAAALGVGSALRSTRARFVSRRSAADLSRCIPRGMVLGGLELTETGTVVSHAHARDGTDHVIVKLARDAEGATSLRRSANRLGALNADARVDEWEVPRPEILDAGELGGSPYVVESAITGEPIARLLDRRAAWQPLAALATQAIEGLHRRTATVLTVDAELLGRWVERPAQAVESLVADSPRRAAAIRQLAQELALRLDGRELAAGWVHGDFHPGNVLIDARAQRITGIIDWELAGTPELPAIDRAMFVLVTHMQTTHSQLGALVAAIAQREASTSLLGSLVNTTEAAVDDVLDPRSLALACWLRHVAALVMRSARYARYSAWKRQNVFQVLDALARG
jgi:aminoglycoside phosphotransferase (APT) family kinase protein